MALSYDAFFLKTIIVSSIKINVVFPEQNPINAGGLKHSGYPKRQQS
jgi:hypothetical protein